VPSGIHVLGTERESSRFARCRASRCVEHKFRTRPLSSRRTGIHAGCTAAAETIIHKKYPL
jgi:hypothetical protein